MILRPPPRSTPSSLRFRGSALRQDIAVTGSVDQFGRVQAIGGVNEKIEGFFRVCEATGLTGTQGVMIPSTNVGDLNLAAEVVRGGGGGPIPCLGGGRHRGRRGDSHRDPGRPLEEKQRVDARTAYSNSARIGSTRWPVSCGWPPRDETAIRKSSRMSDMAAIGSGC